MPTVGLQGHMVALFLVFKGNSILFSIVTKGLVLILRTVGDSETDRV